MIAEDPFKGSLPSLTSSATSWYEIAPSDTEQLPTRPRAVRVGVGGDVCAVGGDGVVATFRGCAAGEILDIRPVQIMAAGTTASNLVALV
ncbi:spike base protein, RCAP_Rcc01079 family [Burkholderia ambifaria]|uniref:spike base protein, RCAP_Rcc01079 family n=1 Tax=Burkholderia ambifaria TaxID=152480 RepID=UPI003C7D5219